MNYHSLLFNIPRYDMLEDQLLLPRRTKRAKALRTIQLYGKYTAKHIRILEMVSINQQKNVQRKKTKGSNS